MSPLGLAGGYGVGAGAVLRAFDRGVNYFYHGSRRAAGMGTAIRELIAGGHRDEIVVVLQCYSRWPWWLERSVMKGLVALGLDHADVLLLGWFNAPPSEALMERAQRLQESGAVRQLAISSHRRPAFAGFARDQRFSVLHVRYNAAHTGAERDVFPMLPAEQPPGIVVYTATRWGNLLDPRRMPAGEQPLRGRDAYRFVLSNPNVNVCITGPKNDAQLDEALATLDEGPLSGDEMAWVRRVGRHVHEHSWLK